MMLDSTSDKLSPSKRPTGSRIATGIWLPSHHIRDESSLRLIAAMAEPGSFDRAEDMFENADAPDRLTPFAHDAVENDVQYFRRRWAEERRASNQAAGPEARAAHRELAARYARLIPRTKWPHGLAPQYRAFTARAHFIDMLSKRFDRCGGMSLRHGASQTMPLLNPSETRRRG